MTFDLLTKSKKSSMKMKSPQFTSFTLFFSLWTVFLSVFSLCFSRNSLISFPVGFSFRTFAVSGCLHSSLSVWVGLGSSILLCSLCLKLQSLTENSPEPLSLCSLTKNPHGLTFLGCLTSLYLQWIHTVPLLFLTLKSCIVKFDNLTAYSLISSIVLSSFDLISASRSTSRSSG